MSGDFVPGGPEHYVPAAGRAGPTGFYDTAIALTMRESRWRPGLRDRVLSSVPSAGRVIDVGAGTGTLAIALATARPDVTVTAVDGDPEILALAQAKRGAGSVCWQSGLADDLPMASSSADAAVMSLVLHHLSPHAKRRALAEVARVLRPGGRLNIADWGRPATPLLRATFFVLQLIDGFENTRDHAAGRLRSGFIRIRLRGRHHADATTEPADGEGVDRAALGGLRLRAAARRSRRRPAGRSDRRSR